MRATITDEVTQPSPEKEAEDDSASAKLPLSVGIFGASGTTGTELARLFAAHPCCAIRFATSRSYAGKSLRSVDPAAPDIELVDPDQADLSQIDVGFVCLPHGESAKVAETCADHGIRVIDLSGDLRLRPHDVHDKVYGTYRSPALAERAVYGLSELFRPAIRTAQVVSNPGCYPTCTSLALYPLAAKGLLPSTVVVDAKSGISGAGRTPTPTTHFCSVSDDVRPYKLGRSHRHTAEIEQTLAACGDAAPQVIFCPHIVPLERGMLVTIVVEVAALSASEVVELYQETYATQSFVDVLPLDEPARIRAAAYTNRAVIGVHSVLDTKHVVITCAIDNLLKGAAGQAVQNMNIMFGFPETLGLVPNPIHAFADLQTRMLIPEEPR